MKKVVLGLIGATALVGSTMAVAGGADNATAPLYGAKTGFYLSGDLGYGNAQYKTENTVTQEIKYKHYNGIAWDVAAGYQFIKNLAVEVGYVGLPSYSIKDADNKSTFGSGYYNLLAKVIYPMGQFDVYGKAGVGLTREAISTKDDNDNSVTIVNNRHNFVPVVGAGADYYLTDKLSTGVQALYTVKTNDVKSSFVTLAGLSYKF